MKLLGIDYGDKKVGIAISDESGNMAFPKETIANDAGLFSHIAFLASDSCVDAIVIGESTDFSGAENPIMKRIHPFKEKLEESLKLPVYFEPEFMTSAEAKHGQEDIEIVDASAAALILQSYIDRIKNIK